MTTLRMDPKEQFLRQVSIIIKTAGILIVVALGGFWFWNPFIMIPGLLLGFGVVRLCVVALKATWKELTEYNPTVSEYWAATFLCSMIVVLFGFMGLGSITLIVQSFVNRL